MLFFHTTTLFMSLAILTAADYECLCNYHVETPVYSIADNKGTVIGHMYEFDCKPTYRASTSQKWTPIQYEKKLHDGGFPFKITKKIENVLVKHYAPNHLPDPKRVGYIAMDVQTNIQTCPGDADPADVVPNTVSSRSFLQTTTTDNILLHSSTDQDDPLTTEPHKTEMKTFDNTGQWNFTTAHTSSDVTAIVNSSPAHTNFQKTFTRSIYSPKVVNSVSSDTLPKFETTVLETRTSTPSLQTESITTGNQAHASTEEGLTETTASVTVAATTIELTTPETGRGKTYLCPFMVKHNTQMQYLSQHGNYCYELYPYDPKDWMSAEFYCRSKKGNLVVISSQEVQHHVEQLLKETQFHYPVWIGLNDLRTEGSWDWIDGSRLSLNSYTNWKANHRDPTYFAEQNCALLDGWTGKWMETACKGLMFDLQRHPWICQYKIN